MGKIKKMMASFLELPESSFGGCRYVEIESDSSVTLNGCTEIMSYGMTEAVFMTCEGKVCIKGDDIELVSYGNGSVKVRGKIDAVVFREGDNC